MAGLEDLFGGAFGSATKAVTEPLSKMVKNTVPPDARVFLETIAGMRGPITEKKFTGSELEELRRVVGTAKKKKADFETSTRAFFKQQGIDEEVDPTPDVISYSDYEGFLDRIKKSGGNPLNPEQFNKDLSPLATTLGRASFSKDKAGNTIITDLYNFNYRTRQQLDRMSLSETLGLFKEFDPARVLGLLSVPDDEGREVRINLGKLD